MPRLFYLPLVQPGVLLSLKAANKRSVTVFSVTDLLLIAFYLHADRPLKIPKRNIFNSDFQIIYSTVTDFAKFLGLSISQPFMEAT